MEPPDNRTTENARVLKAYELGRKAGRTSGMLKTDCPYDDATDPALVLAWRYGWNGHKLGAPEKFCSWVEWWLSGYEAGIEEERERWIEGNSHIGWDA